MSDLREKLIETLDPGDYMDGFERAADRIMALLGDIPKVEITESIDKPATCKVTIGGVVRFFGQEIESAQTFSRTCAMCKRERTLEGMDAYDYNPIQALTGKPLGWYSGDDGEVCPECMTKTIGGQR